MRFLKISFVAALLLGLASPATLAHIGQAVTGMASSAASTAFASSEAASEARRSYADRDAHQLACALYRKWSKADETTRKGSSAAVAAIADRAMDETDDPAARALLTVVPAAVGHGSSVPSRSAQLLLKRECGLGR